MGSPRKISTGPSQMPLDFAHRPALSGDDFLVAPSNQGAVDWLDRWPDWPSPALVLFGPPGSGKSHLANVFMAKTSARALERGDLGRADGEELAARSPVWVVDDADQGWDEEGLLHLYNSLAGRGGHMLFCAKAPPSAWGLKLADLASRLKAAQAVEIGLPGDALFEAVLVKLFSDRQLRVQAGVVDFLVARMERSLDAARRLVAEIDAMALAERRNVTVPLVSRVLGERE